MLQSASEILSTTWSAVESASKLCVTLFLPALLFSEIGPLASWDNLKDYWVILAYAVVFQLISWIFGAIGVIAFGMPQWIISLGKNGTLSPLIKNDDLDSVLDRGQVFLLINALVCNLTRFSFGPTIEPYSGDDENAPLLDQAKHHGKKGWKIAKILHKSLAGFMNPPMYGGLAAIIAGLVPFLHNWLFKKGAWLSPFAVMPVISTSMVYGIRKAVGDKVLNDPVLDFIMMIAPVGPPALTLAAIVEMSDTDEDVETAVAKTIVISYALTPLISVSVTAALQVVQKLY
ncbi:hypothetical protein I302_105068 [Kwoniella bestiolae CBS 10118]|uniref:Endoplasmic reticulum protein n=1 Tax=Kwoniella bestiolae CBS 10118 TaxID=1296100 RepID=A0AAJ8M997_9TREE